MIKINGDFVITPKLTDYDRHYLFNFHATPHLKRNTVKLNKIYDGSNGYVGVYGNDGEYFIKYITDDKGKISDKNVYNISDFDTIIDFKKQPISQPSIECPWLPNNDGTKLITNNDVEHYQHNYGWLKWLVKYFFKIGNKYKLNGEYSTTTKSGENIITIKDNIIKFRSKNNTNKSLSLDDGALTINPQKKNEKTHSEIISDIINKTKNENLNWKKTPTITPFTKYNTEIKIDSTIKLTLSLFILNYSISINNYISIYLVKDNLKRLHTTIKGHHLTELIKEVTKNTHVS